MGLMERLGKRIDNLIRAIAQHGKLECSACGEFKNKGTVCRCGNR
jgi:ribosomal protein L32